MSRPTGAEAVRWNLEDLYATPADLRVHLVETLALAEQTGEAYRSRVAALDAAGLAGLLGTLETLHDRIGRAYTYAFLDWAADTSDAPRGALMQEVREQYARYQQALVFFEVEWAALDEAQARPLYDDERLARFRHSLETQTLRRRHVCSPSLRRRCSPRRT